METYWVSMTIRICDIAISNRHSIYLFDVLRNLVLFVPFKKREKHPWGSANFSKVSAATLLKLTLLYGCLSHFLNCTMVPNCPTYHIYSYSAIAALIFVWKFKLAIEKKKSQKIHFSEQPLYLINYLNLNLL